MMILHTLPPLVLTIIWLPLISAQLTAPPAESRCNPTLSGWNRAGCSTNSDCVCHTLGEGSNKGMCASTMLSCSVLTLCEDDRVTCKQPETICVLDHRCSNKPMCYPIALANLAVCPPVAPTNLTVVVEPESVITVCKEANWTSSTIVAGARLSSGFELFQLQLPKDFIVDENQNIYVADTYNHRVVKWSPNATIGELLAGGRGQGLSREQLNNPTSVVLTPNRDLIICDSGNKRIQRWNHNTNYGETLINGVACRQIFVDESGDLLFTTAKNEIFKCLPTENRTELVMKAGGKNPPKGESNMFLSRTGNLYVADNGNNRILKYAAGAVDADVIAGGQAWQSSELNHLNGPQSVIVDDKGTLYIADSINNRILRWAAGDTIGVVVAKPSGTIISVRFDQNGNLYASMYNSVTRFNINKSACARDEAVSLL